MKRLKQLNCEGLFSNRETKTLSKYMNMPTAYVFRVDWRRLHEVSIPCFCKLDPVCLR